MLEITHLNTGHLNTGQVKFIIQMFPLFRCSLFRSPLYKDGSLTVPKIVEVLLSQKEDCRELTAVSDIYNKGFDRTLSIHAIVS